MLDCAYMNKVEISYTGINQGFKRRQSNPLNDSSPQKTLVVMSTRATPSTADDNKNVSQKV